MDDRIHLSFDLSFLHAEGRWRLPGSWEGYDYYPNPAMYEELARTAERGKFDLLFWGDGTGIPDTWEGSLDAAVKWGIQWPRHDASPLVTIMSRVTKHLGFNLTFASTYMHPYYVARLLNSLDHITEGRIALNLVTSTRRADAANFGYDELADHGARYDKMEEFVDVCQALWSSVEADAIVLDRETGIFADPAKVHPINHDGEYFKVRGPLNCLPSPQGSPVMLQAGSSDRGIRTSAKFADVVFAVGGNHAAMRRHRTKLDEALRENGRNPEDVAILWGVRVVLGEDKASARRRAGRITDAFTLDAAGAYLAHNTGVDLSVVPDRFTLGEVIDLVNANHGSQSGLLNSWQAEHGADFVMTKKEMLERVRESLGSSADLIAGTPEDVADQLEELHEVGGKRGGFMLNDGTDVVPRGLAEFVDFVVPVLQRRGVYRTEYEGDTLRDRLSGPKS